MARGKLWSTEELTHLRQCKSSVEYVELALRLGLPFRTLEAVTTQRHKLGLTNLNQRWAAQEDSILMETYPEGNARVVVQALRKAGYSRSHRGVVRRGKRLSVREEVTPSVPWSEDEETILIDNYPWHTARGVMVLLAEKGFTRTTNAIHRKAKALGVEKGVNYYD